MIFCQNIWRVQWKNRRCHKISVPELTACGACLHPIVSIRDMFRGKNRLSPPEDAVDERLSHGKTGSVHLRTPLMKGYPMEKPASPPEDTVDERLSHGKTGSVHLRTPLMKGYPMEKPAQSTWGRRWWKAIPWKNRFSPPEDAVDERLSHGKTGSVHLRMPLMKGYPMEKPAQSTWGRRWWKAIPWKNRRCPDHTFEEPAMSTILQMWHLRFFPWTLHIYIYTLQISM